MKNDTLTVLENHVFLTGIILFTQRYFKISVPIWIGYQRLLENQKSFGKAFIDTLEQIPSDEIVRFGKRLQEQDWEEERNEKAEAFMKSKMKSSIFKFKFDHSNPKKSFLQSLESVFRNTILAERDSGLFVNLLRPNWKNIEMTLIPNIRSCLQKSLKENKGGEMEKVEEIESKRLEMEKVKISETRNESINMNHDQKEFLFLNDLKSVYQLILECGKFGNIHDLYQSFLMKQLDNVDSLNMKCRFKLALDSLKHIGMIGGTNKKKEHIERLNMEDCPLAQS